MYTPAQAAVVTGLSLRAVRKATENRLVPARTLRIGKNRRCFLSEEALVCLHLESVGLSLFPPATRRKLFAEILRNPNQRIFRPASSVTVDLQSSRRTVSMALRELRKAESMVTENPDVLSGTPVFRGTRVPVHQIALEFEYGATIDEVMESYPSVSREQAALATAYARAHPRTGRPSRQPWHGTHPVKTIHITIPGFGMGRKKSV